MTVNVWTTEYRELLREGDNLAVPIPKEPSVKVTKSAITASAQVTLNVETRIVRVVADAAVYVAFGASPTATASTTLIPSGTVAWFGVTPDLAAKVAYYDGSS